jgi:NADPH:quinone reductase-like Zn-dependent oxidoreductase
MRWVGDGTLDVLIDRTYPLRDAATAHRDIESQKQSASCSCSREGHLTRPG